MTGTGWLVAASLFTLELRIEFFQLHHPLNATVLFAKAASKQPTTWKWTITVANTESALCIRTARRTLRGCQRGNQVLIFLFEADVLLGPWAAPRRRASCRRRQEKHQNESAPTPVRVTGRSSNSPPPKSARLRRDPRRLGFRQTEKRALAWPGPRTAGPPASSVSPA